LAAFSPKAIFLGVITFHIRNELVFEGLYALRTIHDEERIATGINEILILA
jgi:hypothetical protein